MKVNDYPRKVYFDPGMDELIIVRIGAFGFDLEDEFGESIEIDRPEDHGFVYICDL